MRFIKMKSANAFIILGMIFGGVLLAFENYSFVFGPAKISIAEAIADKDFDIYKKNGTKHVNFSEKQGPSMGISYIVNPEVARVGIPRTVTIFFENVTTPGTVSMTTEDAMVISGNLDNWQLQPNRINKIEVKVTPNNSSTSLPLLHLTISDGSNQIVKSIFLKTAGRSQVAGQDPLQETHPLGKMIKDSKGQSIIVITTGPTISSGF